ncbi:hypothetical protein [Paraburkholderia sp. UYCP14C]|nr:hypothetical protein [Paraburkholderia sp. UYCP14C]
MSAMPRELGTIAARSLDDAAAFRKKPDYASNEYSSIIRHANI